MDLNKVMLIGRLTRDPELRTTPQGVPVCQMGLATGYVYTNQQTGQKVENTEFHNIILWRKLGEIANQYLKKGRMVYIEGRLQTRSWDGPDGTKRYKTEIVADNMIMLGGNPQGSTLQQAVGSSQDNTPQSSTPPTDDLPVIQADEPLEPVQKVEDIPF